MQKIWCKHLEKKKSREKQLWITECLEFSRVEVIQKAEEPPLHLLDIGDVGEEGVLDRGWLSAFAFSTLRFGLFFHHSVKRVQ